MASGPGINIEASTRPRAMMSGVDRRRREVAQRKADALADREAKERLHRQMADYWMAAGWPLQDDA